MELYFLLINIHFFNSEDIFILKVININFYNQNKKFNYLYDLVNNYIKKIIYTKNDILIGLPIISNNYQDIISKSI